MYHRSVGIKVLSLNSSKGLYYSNSFCTYLYSLLERFPVTRLKVRFLYILRCPLLRVKKSDVKIFNVKSYNSLAKLSVPNDQRSSTQHITRHARKTIQNWQAPPGKRNQYSAPPIMSQKTIRTFLKLQLSRTVLSVSIFRVIFI